jgi:hypothetical protein
MRWLAIILLMSSCGPSHYLKKAERALKKAEQLGADISADTVYLDREIIVPKTHFDTVLTEVNFRDTITVVKDRVVTKVKVNTVEKKIFVETECPSDTVKIKVPVRVIRKISAGYSLWELIILAVAALAVGFAAGRFLISRRSR